MDNNQDDEFSYDDDDNINTDYYQKPNPVDINPSGVIYDVVEQKRKLNTRSRKINMTTEVRFILKIITRRNKKKENPTVVLIRDDNQINKYGQDEETDSESQGKI